MAARKNRRPARAAQTARTAPAGTSPGLPSRSVLSEFIARSGGRVGKREIARHFGLGPGERVALKAALRELAANGAIAPAGQRRFRGPAGQRRLRDEDQSGDAMLVEITGADPSGDAIGRLVSWIGEGPPPLIFLLPEKRGETALAPGARVLAHIKPLRPGRMEGRIVRRLPGGGRILGVFRATDPGGAERAMGPAGPRGAGLATSGAGQRGGGRIEPIDRRARAEWLVPHGEAGEAATGMFVRAEPLPWHGTGLRPARIVEILGHQDDPRAISRIAIAAAGIPDEFPPAALAEAEAAGPPDPAGREDLRALGLITIDGADARDFDDAVFAEAEGEGFRLVIAIADVAAYVAEDSALDREARARGNSVYFPDRVVPMLPEALSNHWCSLRPEEDRACLFVEIRIGADGTRRTHRFGRGLMRSAARMTYEAVQQAEDADQDPPALPPGLRAALYGAFRALLRARRARGTLELDLPERQVLLDEAGQVREIRPRARLDSHRLIEEFMVLANVAAAETLAGATRLLPFPYRVHAPPAPGKLDGLREFLHGLALSLPPGNRVHPRDLDAVLSAVAGTEQAPLVHETMLRTQSQAEYAVENIGHFGLGLASYAHFTSPIRRYADLAVHRALIRTLGLGAGGLSEAGAAAMEAMAEHVTRTERRAAQAERDATDRYLAAYLAPLVGASFEARVSGVTRFGLFVSLRESGASGIVPLSTLGDDFWVLDEARQALVGRRGGRVLALGQGLRVRLAEATPLTGGLSFRLEPDGADRAPRRRDRPR